LQFKFLGGVLGKITERYEDNKVKGKIAQEHCAQCGRSTRHMIMSSYDHSGSEEYDNGGFSIEWSSSHQVIQCQGCMASSFRELNWFSEDMDGFDNGERITLYPKRSNNTRAIKDFWEVPNNLRRIYRESIDCFNNDSFTLTAAGLRALIDGLCAVLNVTDGPIEITKNGLKEKKRSKKLEGKISGLYEKGFLTEKSANVLHEHRFMGNDAVHELTQPSRDELGLAIEIIEHTFDAIFEIPAKGNELKSRRVRRDNKTDK
jgi:Domain of unknown function (DUF4145)